MTTRRQFLRYAGLGALATALPACSSALPAADTKAPGFGTGATGRVRVWCRSATQTGLTALIADFNRAHAPRLVAELTPVPDRLYVTKLATAVRGREVPDVVDVDDINSLLFAYRDAFTDLTELVGRLGFQDRLSPGHLRLATIEGRHYAVPFLVDASMLYCNTKLFERAGVDVDEATRDLDGLLGAARRITKLGGDVRGWSFPGNSPGALGFVVQPMVWAARTDLVRGVVGEQRGHVAGNDAVRRVLEFYRAIWVDGLAPPKSYSDDASVWGSDYRAGQIGIFPGNIQVVTTGATKDLLANTAIRIMPGPDGGRAFFDGGDNMAIPRGCANPSGAWEFVRFALSLPQQAKIPAGGYAPVRSDVLTPAFAKRFPFALPQLRNAKQGYAPQTLAYNEIYNQPDGPWLTMFRRAVFTGRIEAAMSDAQAAYDRILEVAQA